MVGNKKVSNDLAYYTKVVTNKKVLNALAYYTIVVMTKSFKCSSLLYKSCEEYNSFIASDSAVALLTLATNN